MANDGPLQCEVKKIDMGFSKIPVVLCSVIADQIKIEDIILNRGNCKVEALTANYGAVLEFGQTFDFATDGTCNLLEFAVVANGEKWTFKVNN
jgi:hypothetical protein